MHMPLDILYFGVPMEHDTGSNERGHKPTKTAAKLTQKTQETFDEQTNERLREVHLLELAEQELKGNYVWKYFKKSPDEEQITQNLEKTCIGGSKIITFFDDNTGQNSAAIVTRQKNRKRRINMESQLIDFVYGLQNCVREHVQNLELRSNYHWQGVIFRANTSFKGGTWCDWVIIDWGDEGQLPCHLMGFLDLQSLPPDFNGSYGGLSPIIPGIYAITQCAEFFVDESAINLSEIFIPIRKIIGGLTNNCVSHLQLNLVDVEAFVRPIAIIPDIGGNPNDYFMLKDREEWCQDFTHWLESPHHYDIIEESDDDDSQEDDQQNYASDSDTDAESPVESSDESDEE